ncbi:WHG domain-containing protein [Arthrobacter alpinus]|uniref:TetR-like C-terminal domain-containing protein n=1 Tax=Arthrobacter alpinus TaxID=656366 RepID=UPI0018D12B21
MAEPACYGLLFGSPVPGYQAPAEQTTGPGTRVIGQLVRIFQCAHQAGKLSPQKGLAEPSRAVPSGDFAAIRGGGTVADSRRCRADPRCAGVGGPVRGRQL